MSSFMLSTKTGLTSWKNSKICSTSFFVPSAQPALKLRAGALYWKHSIRTKTNDPNVFQMLGFDQIFGEFFIIFKQCESETIEFI